MFGNKIFPFSFILYLSSFAACTSYQPPFTHYLCHTMTFAEVLKVAKQNKMSVYEEIAVYKGYRLLCFKSDTSGPDVFLIVNLEGKPVLRNFQNGMMNDRILINYVEDFDRHNNLEID